MPLFLSGSNGISGADGTAALPAVQGTDGDTGVFFPAANQVAIATGGVQRLLVDASGNTTLTGTLSVGGVTGSVYPLVLGTAVASTSGTAIDFTGIPSWVRRVTVMLNGVSTNGTSLPQVQLGSGSIQTSGYAVSATNCFLNGVTTTSATSGFVINSALASNALSGLITFSLLSSNTWCGHGAVGNASTNVFTSAGHVALSGVLDRLRITTVNGTDTFDAGSINILFE